ncbi:hypothetical protein C5167_028570 [Papaver somniferum]|uniref:uncharacterized protein LOC113339017 isoform X2 n=1 Tax=Papaver somniferum TaxID=3469 RepID=UPI000E6FDA5B|nr:uncharacterized protein LOC113339017 isoform X2 [Papaver somniferum]RZC90744.1 hypothetical protein C5167_028570 [Papaver somniferum]
MGLIIDEKSKFLRGVKTVFFLITMLASLLIISAPVLLIITDSLLPSALLSAASSFSSSPSSSYNYSSLSLLQSLSSHLDNYDFRSSLVDIPLISIIRSAVIFCVYSICDGRTLSRGRYLIVTTLCSLLSLVFVSLKASYVFSGGALIRRSKLGFVSGAMEIALFTCSLVLAIAHVIVAYRTSCRERRKFLIYNIDIEAVSTCKQRFPAVVAQKKLLEE